MKDYLTYENERNHKNHKLYERFMRMAMGAETNVLVVHHITFSVDGAEGNEIPSADTLMFDHYLMQKVFGENFHYYVAQLAVRDCESRDAHFEFLLDKRENELMNTVSPEVSVCLVK